LCRSPKSSTAALLFQVMDVFSAVANTEAELKKEYELAFEFCGDIEKEDNKRSCLEGFGEMSGFTGMFDSNGPQGPQWPPNSEKEALYFTILGRAYIFKCFVKIKIGRKMGSGLHSELRFWCLGQARGV